jgi:protein-disulfide isomerase
VLRVEPELLTNYVAKGLVSLAFSHALDFGKPSKLASETAECAGKQNPLAFWKMHDLLFQQQDQLWDAKPDLMVQFAKQLGLDGNALESCLDAPDVVAKLTRMVEARSALGIRSRPSFAINGKIVQGSLPYQSFAQLLDELLKK